MSAGSEQSTTLQAEPNNADRSAEAVAVAGQWQPLETPRGAILRRVAIVCATVLGVVLVGALVAVALQFRLLPGSGAVEEITQGAVEIQSSAEGPWLPAQPGSLVRSRARLQAAVGSVATVTLGQGAWMRIESDGEWLLPELVASPNGRLARATVTHDRGQASYVSRPPQAGVDARLRIVCAGATLDLEGVATLVCDEDKGSIHVWQGEGRLTAYEQHVRLGPGEHASLDARQRAILPGE